MNVKLKNFYTEFNGKKKLLSTSKCERSSCYNMVSQALDFCKSARKPYDENITNPFFLRPQRTVSNQYQ
jgi:hypothetical protein